VLINSEGYTIDKENYKILVGIWINEEYNTDSRRPAKIYNKANGKYDEFKNVTDIKPVISSKMKIKETWIDEEGNFWYKAILQGSSKGLAQQSEGPTRTPLHFVGMEIGKVSGSGTILEITWQLDHYPESVDANSDNYAIYYRQ
jgi:hypothetical protein